MYTVGRRLEKVRYRVPVTGGVADVDRYGGELDGLWTAEVEFPTPDSSSTFVPPPWFGAELTDVDGWSNARARPARPTCPSPVERRWEDAVNRAWRGYRLEG